MDRVKTLLISLAVLVLVLVIRTIGCAPEDDYPPLGQVTGRVLLDGKPLPAGLIVLFQPKFGRPASGNTDANGYYYAMYRKRRGALLGTNRIGLLWPTGFEGGVAFPAEYGAESEIDVEVKKGQNVFNIEMKSNE